MNHKSLINNTLFVFLLFWALSIVGCNQINETDQNFGLKIHTKEYKKGLFIDIYEKDSATNADRPLILFVHGGGFAGGSRSDDKVKYFCSQIAQKGYVVASMSYTLIMKGKSFGCDQNVENKLMTFDQVGQEVNEATAFIIKAADKLNINTGQIVLAGSSAGAEAILHAAYKDDLKQNLPQGFKYAGAISMAGAISDINLISVDNAIPMLFFHGTCDQLVPYEVAPHHYCNKEDPGYLILYGSKAIASKLDSLNKSYYLVTACNGNHDWADIPLNKNIDHVIDFLQNDVQARKIRQIHEIIPSGLDCTITTIPSFCETN